MRKFLIFILLLSSCSSLNASSEWKPKMMAKEKMKWDICSARLHGPDYDFKGFCYIYPECRKKFLRKEECRNKTLFCAWGDKNCALDWGLTDRRLVPKS